MCVGYELNGDLVVNKWVFLTPQQGIEIAEAIIVRWGGSDDALY